MSKTDLKKDLEHLYRASPERVGPFSAEHATIARLHSHIKEKGYHLCGKHHEIHLSDPRRTAPDKLKTIIRQPITLEAMK